MPAPRQQFSAEQIETGRKLTESAIAAGAIQANQVSRFPIGTKTETICIDKKRGTVVDRAFQPTTPDAWVADCKRRGVVAVTPNI